LVKQADAEMNMRATTSTITAIKYTDACCAIAGPKHREEPKNRRAVSAWPAFASTRFAGCRDIEFSEWRG